MKQLAYKIVPGKYMHECESPAPLIFPDIEWLKQEGTHYLCSQCGAVKQSCYPNAFCLVVDKSPDEGQIGIKVETTGLFLWHRLFLEQIKTDLDSFVLGKCCLSDGTELKDYCFCYPEKYIVIRGNVQSKYRRCPKCNALYSNVKPGPQYILSDELQKGPVLQDAEGQLYLTDEPAGIFHYNGWEIEDSLYCISLEPISIRKAPADGKPLPA